MADNEVLGPWVVARLCAQLEVGEGELGGLNGRWGEIARGVAGREEGEGAWGAFQRVIADAPDREGLMQAVIGCDPRRRPADVEAPEGTVAPELPKGGRLSEEALRAGEEVGGWLDVYTSYAEAVSPLTPPLFHVSAGLWLASLGVARRVVLRLSHKDLYPNLAVLWVAQTTRYAKSTGLDIARGLAMDLMRFLLLPGAMTPEEIYSELSGQQPTQLDPNDVEDWNRGRAFAGQRGVAQDEASSLFGGFKRDYNVGLVEQLCRLYDCTRYDARQTRALGRVVVREAYWSYLGATTPWHLKSADCESLWRTGLWPRFLLLTPEGRPPVRPPRRERADLPEGLVAGLQRLLQALPEASFGKSTLPIGAGLGRGVFECYQSYWLATVGMLDGEGSTVDGRLWGTYGRLAEQALKVAMLLATLDWCGAGRISAEGESGGVGSPVVELGHWARAQLFVERSRVSAHRLPGLLEGDQDREDENRVLGKLKTLYPSWASARDVYHSLGMKPAVGKVVLQDLVEAGLVAEKQVSAKRRVFRLLKEGDEVEEQLRMEGRSRTVDR